MSKKKTGQQAPKATPTIKQQAPKPAAKPKPSGGQTGKKGGK